VCKWKNFRGEGLQLVIFTYIRNVKTYPYLQELTKIYPKFKHETYGSISRKYMIDFIGKDISFESFREIRDLFGRMGIHFLDHKQNLEKYGKIYSPFISVRKQTGSRKTRFRR
jgi:hypothetical protein